MFLHSGWDRILGNMVFLAIFGKNVEDAYGPLRYLLFYFAGGFAAMMAQTGMTLWFGTTADGRAPTLGASGAIAAVPGAYFVPLRPARHQRPRPDRASRTRGAAIAGYLPPSPAGPERQVALRHAGHRATGDDGDDSRGPGEAKPGASCRDVHDDLLPEVPAS